MLLSHGVRVRPMPVRPGSLTRRQRQTVKMPATHHGAPEAISVPTAVKRCAKKVAAVVASFVPVRCIQGRLWHERTEPDWSDDDAGPKWPAEGQNGAPDIPD